MRTPDSVFRRLWIWLGFIERPAWIVPASADINLLDFGSDDVVFDGSCTEVKRLR